MRDVITLPRMFLATTVLCIWGGLAFESSGLAMMTLGGASWVRIALVMVVVGLANGSMMILTTELVFGTRRFWLRLGEGIVWIGVTLGGVFLCLSFLAQFYIVYETLNQLKLAPAVWMIFQLPLWAVAYGTQWQLQRDRDQFVPRAAWSLRDWMIGCVVLSVSLATAKGFASQASNSESIWLTILAFTGFNAVLIVLPATLYVLRTIQRRYVILGTILHLSCLAVLVSGQMLMTGDFFGATLWDVIGILGIQVFSNTCTVLGPVAGALTYRLSGCRLVSGRLLSTKLPACGDPQTVI